MLYCRRVAVSLLPQSARLGFFWGDFFSWMRVSLKGGVRSVIQKNKGIVVVEKWSYLIDMNEHRCKEASWLSGDRYSTKVRSRGGDEDSCRSAAGVTQNAVVSATDIHNEWHQGGPRISIGHMGLAWLTVNMANIDLWTASRSGKSSRDLQMVWTDAQVFSFNSYQFRGLNTGVDSGIPSERPPGLKKNF
ncbi:hypothetical protein DFH09DRAFT_1096257 [Mycena vulgaris]|nr:hypothetical protein DFH09DRAFT_1096257 [Mycena vulgaris]